MPGTLLEFGQVRSGGSRVGERRETENSKAAPRLLCGRSAYMRAHPLDLLSGLARKESKVLLSIQD